MNADMLGLWEQSRISAVANAAKDVYPRGIDLSSESQL
jgi:hypothetical protein